MGSVEDFVISEGVLKTYKGKESIVIIPDGVVEISQYAFNSNKSMKELIMPDSVTKIESFSFYLCKKLEKITFSSTLESIEEMAFCNCEKLVSISLPESLRKIGYGAFCGCTSLRSIDIKANLDDVEIASNMLDGCTGMADSDGFIIFDRQLMGYCGKAKIIEVPDGVIYISNGVFKNNTEVESITLPSSVKEVGDSVFEGCKKLCKLIIPEAAKIGFGAFTDCKKLIDENDFVIINGTAYGYYGKSEELVIPEGVKIISKNMLTGNWWGDRKGKNIKTISFPSSLEIIEAGAFKSCGQLTEIIIPESVKIIEDYAFAECHNVKKVSMPKSVKLGISSFSKCSSLKDENGFVVVNSVLYNYYSSSDKVEVPDGIEAIGPGAFTNTIVKSVKLPKTVKVIGDSVFYHCEQLTSIEMNEGIESIGESAFGDCISLENISIPSSVKVIGQGAFRKCKKLEKVILPDGIEKMEQRLFSECISLKEVNIPGTVKKIDSYVFSKCEQLVEIIIPDSVEELGRGVFDGCKKLINVSISKVPPKMSADAFDDCDSLVDDNGLLIVAGILFKYVGEGGKIVIPEGVKEICPNVFREGNNGGYIRFVRYRDEGQITEVVIPNGVTTIHSGAFAGITKLKKVTLPDSLEYLGKEAFRGCVSLESVSIPDKKIECGIGIFAKCESVKQISIPGQLETIPEGFLMDCKKVKKIEIGEGIKKIGRSAFIACESLTEINLPSSLEVISIGAFKGCKKMKEIRIPLGVCEIQTGSFDSCDALASIQVEDDNSTYSMVDGLLCSKDGKEIIVCPAGLKLEEYTIKDGVTTIHERAFMSCNSLKKVVIPSSVIRIGDEAFPQSGGRQNNKLTDIQVDPRIKLSYVGEEIFGFPNGDDPLVYPFLPPTVVKEQTTQVRLGLGFCSSPSSYTGEYLDLYKKYADSHQKTLLKKATDLKLKEVLNYYSETDETNSVTGKIEKVNYKKLSEVAKVEFLERVIIEGDLNALKEAISGCGKFEFTARALGIACLYGGLDKVKLLVDSGAKFTFKYDPALKRKYGCAYAASKYSTYKCEYDLMVANDGINALFTTTYASTQEFHFGKLPEINKKPLNADERASIADYLCDNAKKAGFNTNNVLFYAIMWGCKSVAETLIKKGCELTKDGIKALSDSTASVPRNEVLCTLPVLKPDKCAYAISQYADLLDKKGLKFLVSQKVFEYKNTPFISDEVIGVLIDRVDTSKLTKSKVLELVVKDNKIAAIEKLAEAEWFKTPAQRNKLIKYATDNKCKAALAWLLDYKNRTADVKKEAAKAEAKMMKELTEDPNSASAIKKSWITKKAEDGTLILTNYKGESTEIVVPAIIGKTPVSKIGEGAIKAYSIWCPAKIKNNDVRKAITSVVISEGIKEISTDAFSGLEELVKVEIPDSVVTIGNNAFRNCKKLTFDGLRMPTDVKFGASAFFGCNGLINETGCAVINSILVAVDTLAEEIIVPDGVLKIAPYAFGGGLYSNNDKIKKIVLPSTVKNIGEGAFAGCTVLESVNIPNGIKIIREETFNGCKQLKELVFPDSVTTFRKDAFNDCDSLKIIKIPASVTSINEKAFGYMPWGKTIYTPAGSKAEEYFTKFTDHYITVITE